MGHSDRIQFGLDLCSVRVRLVLFRSIWFSFKSVIYFISSKDIILAKLMLVRFDSGLFGSAHFRFSSGDLVRVSFDQV